MLVHLAAPVTPAPGEVDSLLPASSRPATDPYEGEAREHPRELKPAKIHSYTCRHDRSCYVIQKGEKKVKGGWTD